MSSLGSEQNHRSSHYLVTSMLCGDLSTVLFGQKNFIVFQLVDAELEGAVDCGACSH